MKKNDIFLSFLLKRKETTFKKKSQTNIHHTHSYTHRKKKKTHISINI